MSCQPAPDSDRPHHHFEALALRVSSVYGFEGNTKLGRPRSRWEVNIKMCVREIVLKGIDWIYLAQDLDRWRIPLGTVLNLRFL